MSIKTLPQPLYSTDHAPSDFWLFPKLRGCRYETIDEMKEAVTKVIDTLTQEDIHGTFQKLLELYKCIATEGDYLEGDKSFICLLSIKLSLQNKSRNLFNDSGIYIYMYIYIYIYIYEVTLIIRRRSLALPFSYPFLSSIISGRSFQWPVEADIRQFLLVFQRKCYTLSKNVINEFIPTFLERFTMS